MILNSTSILNVMVCLHSCSLANPNRIMVKVRQPYDNATAGSAYQYDSLVTYKAETVDPSVIQVVERFDSLDICWAQLRDLRDDYEVQPSNLLDTYEAQSLNSPDTCEAQPSNSLDTYEAETVDPSVINEALQSENAVDSSYQRGKSDARCLLGSYISYLNDVESDIKTCSGNFEIFKNGMRRAVENAIRDTVDKIRGNPDHEGILNEIKMYDTDLFRDREDIEELTEKNFREKNCDACMRSDFIHCLSIFLMKYPSWQKNSIDGERNYAWRLFQEVSSMKGKVCIQKCIKLKSDTMKLIKQELKIEKTCEMGTKARKSQKMGNKDE